MTTTRRTLTSLAAGLAVTAGLVTAAVVSHAGDLGPATTSADAPLGDRPADDRSRPDRGGWAAEPSASPQAPTGELRSEPEPRGEPSPDVAPTDRPGPAILAPGDTGPEVRDLQARLQQIGWFAAEVTDYYGEVTQAAVRGFQAKRGIPVTGEVDRRTLDRLHAMTHEPTAQELTGQAPATGTPAALDDRCLTGRVLCVDKTSRTLRWVVDGEVQMALDARFGGNGYTTREGVFSVYRMSRDHVSSLYGSSMPYAMFFSGGQAVHYSPDFAAVGYAGASHGCVNVRDLAAVAALYDQVQLGDRVVVYWS